MSKNPKESFLKRFEEKHTIKRIFGQSFYELNSTATLYFRFSKAHRNQFFFGVESDDLLNYKDKNLFLLFICDNDDEIIVLPVEDFLTMVEGTKPISNQWKISIFREQDNYFLRISGKGKFDVTKNLNQFDFRPKEFRISQLPSIGPFIPLGRKKEQRKTIQANLPVSEALEDRLIASSSDSKHPTIFEKVVSEVFERLGFKVKHIGGAGNTDILIESPIRGIIDCKSTIGTLNHINIPRLKRHKKDNEGSFLLIVSVDFIRAVIRDAESEGCTLLPVKVLKEILTLSKIYTFSPFELETILTKAGIITLSDIEYLKLIGKSYREQIDTVLRVVKSIDFKHRGLKEIKGRLDYESEQKHQKEISEQELEDILNLLTSPLFSIVQKKEDVYWSRYTHLQSVEKIKNTLKELLSPNNKE
jgi:hypothetical protein